MFLSVIALALVVGALAGGGIPRLADLRLKLVWSCSSPWPARGRRRPERDRCGAGLPIGWFFVGAYLLLFVFLAANYRVPGLQVAAVGIGLNTLAVILNAGRMPIWANAFEAAGFSPSALVGDPFHFLIASGTVAEFVSQGGVFGDVVPIPVPLIRDVVSIGDLLLAMGIFWAIVYSMTRADAPERAVSTVPPRRDDPFPAATLATSTAAAGQTVPPLPAPSLVVATAAATVGAPAVRAERAQSPYLALIRNRNFSLLWTGQLISFGDRIHQVALGVLLIELGTLLDLASPWR